MLNRDGDAFGTFNILGEVHTRNSKGDLLMHPLYCDLSNNSSELSRSFIDWMIMDAHTHLHRHPLVHHFLHALL